MITAYAQTRAGGLIAVTVTSSLTGAIYYFWYLDGVYAGMTTAARKSFLLAPGDQTRVACIDSTDPAFDYLSPDNAPAGFPARRNLQWVRSLDPAIAQYRVDQKRADGAWTTIGKVLDRPGQWTFSFTTPRLDDLIEYAWRIVPLDIAGNAGTPLDLPSETIVRAPDAPALAIAFDPGTLTVTFSESDA